MRSRRLRASGLVLGLLIAAITLSQTVASGSSPCTGTALAPSCFEAGDGDLVAGSGHLDWSNVQGTASSDATVPYEVTLTDGTGASDDSLSGGTKEDQDPNTWTFTTNPGTNNDFRAGVFARDLVPNAAKGRNDVFIYAAFERVGTNGTNNMSIELNKLQPVLRLGKKVPNRSDDDLLVLFDDQLSSVRICKWKSVGGAGWYQVDANGVATGTKLGGSDDCTNITALKAGAAVGRAGVGALANPGYLAGFSDPIAANAFGEVGLNLTELLGGAGGAQRCFSYGSVFMHSRVSSSGTASMDDYVAPKEIPATGNCSATVVKKVSTSAAGPFTNDTSTGTASPHLYYEITATNSGTVELKSPAMADPGCDNLAPKAGGKRDSDGDADATPATFDPGDQWTWTCDKAISPDPAVGSSYVNTASFSGVADADKTPTVTASDSSTTTFIDAATTSLSVAKKVATSLAGPYTAGPVTGVDATQPLFYEIAVTNTGTATLTNLALSDVGTSDPDAGGPSAGTTKTPGCSINDTDGTLKAPARRTKADGTTPDLDGSFDAGDIWTWTCSQTAAAGGFTPLGTYANQVSAAGTAGATQVFSQASTASATFKAAPAGPGGGGDNTGGGGDNTGGGDTTNNGGTTTTGGTPTGTGSSTNTGVVDTTTKFTRTLKGCLDTKRRVAIKGRSIAKVTFYVDGKKRKTQKVANKKGQFTFDVSPSLTDTKKHKLKAVVDYKPGSGFKRKTLTQTYRSCGCKSKRSFNIRIVSHKADPVVSAKVLVNGSQVKVIKGKRLTAPVKLTGLPKGTYVVKIIARTKSGKKQVGTRKYRTCRPNDKKKRKSPKL